MDDERARILEAHAALVAGGSIERLSRDAADTRLWLDCELSSLVENRFFEPLDPAAMTPALRERWELKATLDGERLTDPHEHAWYAIPYWIVEDGERKGTIGLSTTFTGARLVTVSSLFVLPAHRGRGVARRALERADAAVHASRARGLRVPTYWTWQPAVRFYLGIGMWVSNWKHSLVFARRDDLPEHRIEVGEREASFGVVRDGRVERLITATREGDRLGWIESPRMQELARASSEAYFLGPGTFALGLALQGFPLIRGARAWDDRHMSADMGDPEGLAYKIEIFEAVDRRDGFIVRTPRVPGLSYRDYHEID